MPVEAAARAAQCDASRELAVSITAAAHDVIVQPGPFTLQAGADAPTRKPPTRRDVKRPSRSRGRA
eukprot:7111516-Lingulodinium_polyedra.AAC.1